MTKQLIVILLTTGCVTTSYVDVKLPTALESEFDTCHEGDGLMDFKLNEGGGAIGNLQVEWVIENKRTLKTAFFNDIGQNMLTMQIDQKTPSINVNGMLKDRLPQFTVEKGFIHVDGHLIGFRPSEIFCLVKHKFPKGWLDRVKSKRSEKKLLTLFVEEKKRDIEVKVKSPGNKKKQEICATVSWSQYFFTPDTEIQVCSRGPENERVLEFSGYDDYQMVWTKIDE
jgi:hypothetical protein